MFLWSLIRFLYDIWAQALSSKNKTKNPFIYTFAWLWRRHDTTVQPTSHVTSSRLDYFRGSTETQILYKIQFLAWIRWKRPAKLVNLKSVETHSKQFQMNSSSSHQIISVGNWVYFNFSFSICLIRCRCMLWLIFVFYYFLKNPLKVKNSIQILTIN